jgi:AcrR family transcriptional regulator
MARSSSRHAGGAPARRDDGTEGKRAAWGTVSRESIVDAAMRVVAAGGFDQLSIRGLAADLGVAPMTIYRHVADKDDLLDEVVDRLLARSWRPRRARDDWRAWITQAADRLRRLLVTQPAALHVYLRRPVVSPAAVTRMNAMMEVLRAGMDDEGRARRAYAAIHVYTLGFAALQASRAAWQPAGADVDELASELSGYTSPRQFAEGLGYLLDGIAA